MKRKTRFNDGGMNRNPYQGDDVDPFSAVRDASGSTDPRQEGPSSEAFYDETTGKMLGTRRNLETGEYYSTEPIEAPKAAPKPARAMPKAPEIVDVPGGGGRGTMAGRRAIDDIMRDAGGGGRGRSMGRTAADVDTFTPGKGRGRAEIPVDSSMSGPEKRHSFAMDTTDTQRQFANLAMYGAGRAGLLPQRLLGNAKSISSSTRMMPSMLESAKETAKGAASRITGEAKKAETAAEAAKAFSKPQAREVASKVPARASQASKERAEAMEKAKPILQSRPDTKSSRAARTRRTEEDMGIEFSKGGSTASRRADGCAMRGKTRGKIY